MKVYFLGTGSAFATPGANPSGLVFQSGGDSLLCDTGEGTALRLAELGIDTAEIESVWITHTHPDHASGLVWLLQQMRVNGRTADLQIYLPAAACNHIDSMLSWFMMSTEKYSFNCSIAAIRNTRVGTEQGISVLPVPNGHIQPASAQKSYSLIFSGNGKNICYTSDVDSLSHLTHVAGIDLLITECTHISIDEIRNFVRAAGIKKTILTHIPPDLMQFAGKQITDEAGLTVSFASDKLVIEV